MPATYLTWSAGVVPNCAIGQDNTTGSVGSVGCSHVSTITFGKFDVTDVRFSAADAEPQDIRYDDDPFHDNQPEKTEPPQPSNDWWSNLSGETSRAAPSTASLHTTGFANADGGGGGSWAGTGPPAGRSAGWFTVY